MPLQGQFAGFRGAREHVGRCRYGDILQQYARLGAPSSKRGPMPSQGADQEGDVRRPHGARHGGGEDRPGAAPEDRSCDDDHRGELQGVVDMTNEAIITEMMARAMYMESIAPEICELAAKIWDENPSLHYFWLIKARAAFAVVEAYLAEKQDT